MRRLDLPVFAPTRDSRSCRVLSRWWWWVILFFPGVAHRCNRVGLATGCRGGDSPADLAGWRTTSGPAHEYLLGRIFEATAGPTRTSSPLPLPAHISAICRRPRASLREQIGIGSYEESRRGTLRQMLSSPQIASSPILRGVLTDQKVQRRIPTDSDFVQSARMVLQAWRHKMRSQVEFDESAGVWSLDISIRIDDPADQTPLGVLKSVLSIKRVQQIADRNSVSLAGARVVVATGDGLLIAETSSNHARERIMSESTNVREHGSPALQGAFGAERSGSSAGDGMFLTAYARTAGGRLCTGAPRFPGFGLGWSSSTSAPGVLAPLGPLAQLSDEVDACRGAWHGSRRRFHSHRGRMLVGV